MTLALQLPLPYTTSTLVLDRDNFKAKCDAKKLHTHLVKTGKHSDVFLATKLVQMYGKSGNIEDARHVFDEMSQRNLVTWNVMIGVYVQCGEAEEALKLFRLMQTSMIKMSHITASSVVKACTALSALKHGRELHAHIVRSGFELDIVLYTTLIDMYWKGGSKLDACKVFDEMPLRNVISWSVMISGCVQNGFEEKAVDLFLKMQMGFNPNQYIYSSIIKACAVLLLVELVKQLHALVSKAGLESDVIVGSALLDGYVKCGNIEAAKIVFERISRWDVVSWTTMIGGHIQVGRDDEALELFFEMLEYNLMKPNHFTYSGVLRACSNLADMESGKQIHAHLMKTLVESNVSVGNSLISMYARCGNIDDSRKVFDLMSARNVVSWNAMITGYALHGNCEEGIRFFKQMQFAGIKPNHITFVGVLTACSHGGLVEQGRGFFHSMRVDHGIEATMEHYACMVDLLGRAGRLEEALEIIRQIPQQPTALIWRTLLGACKVHGNLELGYCAAQALLKLEPNDSATYVLLSGYFSDPEATGSTLDKNGWLHMGDICYINTEGYAFVVDRLEELIEYKGNGWLHTGDICYINTEGYAFVVDRLKELIKYKGYQVSEQRSRAKLTYVVRKQGSTLSEATVIAFVTISHEHVPLQSVAYCFSFVNYAKQDVPILT